MFQIEILWSSHCRDKQSGNVNLLKGPCIPRYKISYSDHKLKEKAASEVGLNLRADMGGTRETESSINFIRLSARQL
jgi:hypothetical protein